MDSFEVKALTAQSWEDFAALAGRHNGVWGGCWCMAFHAKGPGWGVSAEANRAEKQALVQVGRAQAALVYAKGACVGWCQFGPVAELPRIKAAKAYREGLVALPDWRVTCFFVDKAWRGTAAFLHGGTVGMFERAGFARQRRLGKAKWVVRRAVAAGLGA